MRSDCLIDLGFGDYLLLSHHLSFVSAIASRLSDVLLKDSAAVFQGCTQVFDEE